MKFTYPFLLLLVPVLLFSACKSQPKKSKYPDTDMYNFSSPKVIELETDLDEISGIAYYPKDTSVFAIVDEDGILFKIPLNNPKKSRRWTFAKSKDYEDLVYMDSAFYIMVSNGTVEKITFNGYQPKREKFEFFTGDKKQNEFETLYKKEFSKKLTMICKSCEEDDKEHLTLYSFEDSSGKGIFKRDTALDMRTFIQKYGADKHLKPSGAAVNPRNGDIYVLSSILKVIMILDRNREFKEFVKLDPVIYKQPEGITFTPEGNIIISNEFANEGYPNLLLLKNKKN